MGIIPVICVLIGCIFILLAIVGGIWFAGSRTDSPLILTLAMLGAFLLSYFVFDFAHSMLVSAYNFPVVDWGWDPVK